jgi:hypothetical protein
LPREAPTTYGLADGILLPPQGTPTPKHILVPKEENAMTSKVPLNILGFWKLINHVFSIKNRSIMKVETEYKDPRSAKSSK